MLLTGKGNSLPSINYELISLIQLEIMNPISCDETPSKKQSVRFRCTHKNNYRSEKSSQTRDKPLRLDRTTV